MNTKQQLVKASPIRQAEDQRVGPYNQCVTTRMYAAVLAFALVLPAMGAVIDGLGVSSSGLCFLGFFFLIGFGVPYYILLHRTLEADIASEIEGAQYVPARAFDETLVAASQTAPSHGDGRQALHLQALRREMDALNRAEKDGRAEATF